MCSGSQPDNRRRAPLILPWNIRGQQYRASNQSLMKRQICPDMFRYRMQLAPMSPRGSTNLVGICLQWCRQSGWALWRFRCSSSRRGSRPSHRRFQRPCRTYRRGMLSPRSCLRGSKNQASTSSPQSACFGSKSTSQFRRRSRLGIRSQPTSLSQSWLRKGSNSLISTLCMFRSLRCDR
jgi:hypothetical protein